MTIGWPCWITPCAAACAAAAAACEACCAACASIAAAFLTAATAWATRCRTCKDQIGLEGTGTRQWGPEAANSRGARGCISSNEPLCADRAPMAGSQGNPCGQPREWGPTSLICCSSAASKSGRPACGVMMLGACRGSQKGGVEGASGVRTQRPGGQAFGGGGEVSAERAEHASLLQAESRCW